MKLEELRKRVDLIDSEIVKLLGARMELALRTGKHKDGVSDPKREENVFANVKKCSVGLVRPEFSGGLFKEIISESKKIQDQHPVLVAFQGEHGAFGEMAIRAFLPPAVPISCREFEDVFTGVENGSFDFGMVPVENSIEGAVTRVNDLLVESSLRIVGEVRVPVHHCLLALPEADYREIKVAYSHPQALSQCRGFLQRNKLEARPFYDTAGAAMMLAEDRPRAAAAIASRLCAELYGLEILKENVEDHKSNSTRFLVLSRKEEEKEGANTREGAGKSDSRGQGVSGRKGGMCSIIFSTDHKAGALFSVLKVFSDASLNLTRIESRPIKSDPGKYAFFLDFEGFDQDAKVAAALSQVEKMAVFYKYLGCYPSWKQEAKA
ncbi:MAG: prephenate dehydratase [Candidatus Micrarchaeota archaeon]|nr:prephenate dehydratase [Candidatus Micrarchaeota archaeon]